MTSLILFEVGGCVRDSVLGIPTKDIDFAVDMRGTAPTLAGTLARLGDQLTREGFGIFKVDEPHLTIRARFPKDHEHRKLVADFVVCRKDGPSSDGRHPDFVEAGTIEDDLARRDFTMNAMARTPEGEIIDLFGGLADIEARIIRFVGDPMARIHDDSLRVLRALRFTVTKGFDLAPATLEAITDPCVPELLSTLPKERMRDELDPMFRIDTLAALDLLMLMPPAFREVVFASGLRLKPTQEA